MALGFGVLGLRVEDVGWSGAEDAKYTPKFRVQLGG